MTTTTLTLCKTTTTTSVTTATANTATIHSAYLGHLPALASFAAAVRQVLSERGERHVDQLDSVPLPLVPPGHRHRRHSPQSRGVSRGVRQAGAHQLRGEAEGQLVDGGVGVGRGETEVEAEVELVVVVRDGVVVEVQPPLAVRGESLLRGEQRWMGGWGAREHRGGGVVLLQGHLPLSGAAEVVMAVVVRRRRHRRRGRQ